MSCFWRNGTSAGRRCHCPPPQKLQSFILTVPIFDVSLTNMKSRKPNLKLRGYEQTARAQMAQENGERIAAAFKDLLMQMWFDEITLDRVAADAGTTVQTIVRRFGGKDGLLEAAAKLIGIEVNARREKPTGDLHRIIV